MPNRLFSSGCIWNAVVKHTGFECPGLRLWLATVLATFAALRPTIWAGELDEARAAFRQVRESIQSLHLFVDVESAPSEWAAAKKLISGPSRSTVEWWLTADKARWRQVRSGLTIEQAWSDAELRSLARDTRTYGSVTPMPKLNAATNPWRYAQWTIPDLSMTLDEVCTTEGVTAATRWEGSGDDRLLRVDLNYRGEADIVVWLSPRCNFVPVRQTYRQLQHKVASDDAVLQFRELRPGIFFPERVETKRYCAFDQLLMTQTRTFRNVELNAAIPAKVFELKFPPNITVVDEVRGQQGRTGPDGKLMLTAAPTLTTAVPDGEEVVLAPRATWTYTAFAIGLAAVGVVWLIVRYRSPAAHP